MNAISKLFSTTALSVLNWLQTYAQNHAPEPKVDREQRVAIELDKMWHYIGNKKNKL